MIQPLTILPFLLQAADDLIERETEALLLAVVGMAVVFTALLLIGSVVALLGKIFARESKTTAAPEEITASAHGMGIEGAEQLDPRLIAILSAAAFTAIGKPVRVYRVTFINRNTISAWAEVGRMSIQSSHKMRRSL